MCISRTLSLTTIAAPRARALVFFPLLVALGAACGPVVDETDGGPGALDAGLDPDAGEPAPTLTAPSSIEVPEGRQAAFTFVSNVDVTATASGALTVVVEDDTARVHAPIGSAGGTVELSGPGVSATVTVTVVALAFSRVTWVDGDGPVAREHGAMMVSDDGKTLYVLGGGGYPNVPTQEILSDAWSYNVNHDAWSSWALTGDVPEPMASRRVARATGDVAFLHGGYGDGFDSDDALYRVELATGACTRLTQVNTPPARSLHAFAFDETGQRFVVFGGFYGNGNTQAILDDTWVGAYDAVAGTVEWAELTSAGPAARYGMFAGFDEDRRELVVYSGAGTPVAGDPINAHDDTWVLSLGDAVGWRAITPAGDPPGGRRNGCGVVDTATHTLLVSGGTADGATTSPGVFVLALDGEPTWHAIDRPGAPPLRSSAFGAPWPGGGVVCGFGNDAARFQDLFFLR